MQTTEELQAALLIASEGMQAAKRIIERKNKQLLAAEAEISRLHSGFDGLKQYAVNCINRDGLESDEWEDGYLFASVRFLKEINRIAGADK